MALPLPPHPTQLVVVTVVAASNALLAREPWARERLLRHRGKTVRVVWSGYHAELTVTRDGYMAAAEQMAEHATTPDVTLTVITEKLTLDRLRTGTASADGFADLIHVAGDAALAQTVAELGRDLRPDLEDLLAERLGDIAARRLVQAVRTLHQRVRTSGARLAGNIAEYLSEEAGVLLARPAFADAQQTLAALDAHVSALTARIQTLQNRPNTLTDHRESLP